MEMIVAVAGRSRPSRTTGTVCVAVVVHASVLAGKLCGMLVARVTMRRYLVQ